MTEHTLRWCINNYRFLSLTPTDNQDALHDSPFTSAFPPTMTPEDYTKRLMTYILDDPHLLDLTYYFAAIYSTRTNYRITTYTIHRLLLTSAILLRKFWGDFEVSSERMATIGGVSAKELLTYELKFLGGIDWRLYSVSAALTDSELKTILETFTGLPAAEATHKLLAAALTTQEKNHIKVRPTV